MQFNPYNTVANLPRNQIGELMNVGRQSQKDVGQNLLSAVDSLRGVGVANENQLYNTKLTALQNSPEFLNANPMQRQTMIQSASSGLELDKQNLTGQEQLFKSLGQEQENLNLVDRAKTADENALVRLGIDISARQADADVRNAFTASQAKEGNIFKADEEEKERTFKAGESDKQRTYNSAEAEKIANATKEQNRIRNELMLKELTQNPYTPAHLGFLNKQTGEYTSTDSKGGSDYDSKMSGDTLKYANMQTGANKEKLKAMFNTGQFRVVDIPFFDEKGKHIQTKDTRVFEVYGNTYQDEQSAKEAISKGKQTTENVNKPFDANAIPTPVKKLIQEKQSQPFNWSGTNLDRTSPTIADAVRRTGGYGNRIAEANAMRAKLGLPPIK